MIYKKYPFAQYFCVYCLCSIACLVGVHCDSGGEEYCGNAVVYEDPLVGQAVEHTCEVLASVICQVDLKVNCGGSPVRRGSEDQYCAGILPRFPCRLC